MNGNSRFLRACRLQPTDRTPVWFMRQAGRVFPEYRALRERYSFLTLCRTPELAARVTLQPVEELGVDAAILFSDIMIPLDGLGVPYDLREGVGPVLERPLRRPEDVDGLRRFDPREDLAFVMETVAMVRRELPQERALIGFAGAPFTLACYLIEGRPSRDFRLAKQFMYSHAEAWHRLMDLLSDVVLAHLRAQVEAGVDAVQLFDSWVGGLAPRDYEEFVFPYARKIFAGLKDKGAPRIHFGVNTATLLPWLARAGADVVGADWRIPIDEARRALGANRAIQGNLDPATLLGPFSLVRKRTLEILERMRGQPGHIFNLGHGVLPETPLDHLKRLVETVHESSENNSVGGGA